MPEQQLQQLTTGRAAVDATLRGHSNKRSTTCAGYTSQLLHSCCSFALPHSPCPPAAPLPAAALSSPPAAMPHQPLPRASRYAPQATTATRAISRPLSTQ